MSAPPDTPAGSASAPTAASGGSALDDPPLDEPSLDAAARQLLAAWRSGRAGERLAPALLAAHAGPTAGGCSGASARCAARRCGGGSAATRKGRPRRRGATRGDPGDDGAARRSTTAPGGPERGGRIEPELAYEFRTALPPRDAPYTAADLDAAIGSVRLAIEVMGCRYADAGAASGPELMADGMWHQSLVLGPPIAAPVPASYELGLWIDGEAQPARAARHPDGDPRAPLLGLVEFLRTHGDGIAAGQAVITGSWAGAIELPFGRTVRLRYGELGEIALRLERIGG